MQKELAQQEKVQKSKSDAERKLLLGKMAKDAANAQARLYALKNELAAANKTLQDLNKKLNTPPTVVPAAEVVQPVKTQPETPAGATEK